MIRSIGAVLGGFALFSLSAVLLFQLSDRPPEIWPGAAFATFAISYGAVFALVAGFLTARLAPRAPLGHALVFAALLNAAAGMSFVGDISRAALWRDGGFFRVLEEAYLNPAVN